MTRVEAILADNVRIRGPGTLGERLGARLGIEGTIEMPYATRSELATILTVLQGLDVPFADAPHGWPPAAVFAQLRDEGLVRGSIRTVAWTGPGQPVEGEG